MQNSAKNERARRLPFDRSQLSQWQAARANVPRASSGQSSSPACCRAVGNDRYLRSPVGWSRRQPTVRDNREARLSPFFLIGSPHETVKAETGSRVADCGGQRFESPELHRKSESVPDTWVDTIRETLARSTATPRDGPKQPPLNARNKPEMSDGGDWQRVSPDVSHDLPR
jgi:hypothetical protein